MGFFINLFLSKGKAVIAVLVFVLISGLMTYINIPKESSPDVKIPYIFVSVTLPGIAPADSESLILKPLEQNLKNIDGVKEMKSVAYQGGGHVVLEFKAGFDSDKALQKVRDHVKDAKAKLPKEANEPIVSEVNLSLFPVLLVKLSGEIPVRTLYKMAKDLRDAIEGNVPQVMSATIQGMRDERVEIVLDPSKIESYAINMNEAMQMFQMNNAFVPAGNIVTAGGEFAVNIPGLANDVLEIMEFPIKVTKNGIIKFSDIASIKRNFKNATSITRDMGKPAVVLEIVKRTGENLIDTIAAVKYVCDNYTKHWPDTIKISYASDESEHIKEMLLDLQNNIIGAIILVALVIIASLGLRSSILIGIAIPGSFLAGILCISLLGYTINMVVLFSLILAVGMLVEGAIIVVEYADRRMIDGDSPREAYKNAAIRMAWPVITSISTILLAFLPLLFWPGIVGQFMKYLPVTLIATLTASILMALIFIPVLGMYFAKQGKHNIDTVLITESGDLNKLTGFMKIYVDLLHKAITHPYKVILSSVGLLILIVFVFATRGPGIEFFPDIEPDMLKIGVYGRGNLSIDEKDEMVRSIEEQVLGMKELKSVYARVGSEMSSVRQDMIGSITVELIDWQERRKAGVIIKDIESRLSDIKGVQYSIDEQKAGPKSNKPISIEVSSIVSDALDIGYKKIEDIVRNVPGVNGVQNDRGMENIEWKISIDRQEASKFGANVVGIGNMIKLITNGVKVGVLRPYDVSDEIDILLFYPKEYRTLNYLSNLNIYTQVGLVPISNFVKKNVEKKSGVITRVGGKRAVTISAGVDPGVILNDKIVEIKRLLSGMNDDIQITFKGEDRDQQESSAFLSKAFLITIFLIAIVMLIQFNSFFQSILVLSAVILSIGGALVGFMIHWVPLGIVMGGIGIIALAGIIVSNNIILIDTFNQLKQRMPVEEAIVRTGAQRLRPVLLTKLTTILGLLPIMFQVNIDFVSRKITYGAPSSQWWVQLSMAIIYGVLFASSLTLFVTPSALMAKELFSKKRLKNK